MISTDRVVRCLVVSALLITAPFAQAESPAPALTFESGTTWLRGGAGTHVAWLGMVRTRDGSHVRVRYVRGSEPIPAAGLSLGQGSDTTNSVWAIADTGDLSLLRSSNAYPESVEGIEVIAANGATEIAIHAGVVHGTLVRPDGDIWAFAAGDGDVTDAGPADDGWIVLSLNALSRFEGNPPAPTELRSADTILLLDPQEERGAVARVTP